MRLEEARARLAMSRTSFYRVLKAGLIARVRVRYGGVRVRESDVLRFGGLA